MIPVQSTYILNLKKFIVNYPWLYREYWFFKVNIRYMKRALIRTHEWKSIIKKPPILAGFNTTDFCNARCCYCAYVFQEPEGVMDMEIFKKGVKDFSDMGGGAIGLSPLTGEPLLDPYLEERIEFASKFPNIKKVTFNTNGILLSNKKIRDTLIRVSSGIQIEIYISLPGFEKEMFQRVYKTDWNEEILTGIRDLLKTNRKSDNPIHIILSLQPDMEGVQEFPEFKSQIRPLINEKDIQICEGLRDNWCGQVKQHHLTGNMKLKRQPIFNRLPCEILLDRHVDILANGDVRMCGCRFGKDGKHDDLVIGNIRENRLSDIWFGEGAGKVCEDILNGIIPSSCLECSMYMPY